MDASSREPFRVTPAVRWLAIAWVGVAIVQATVTTPADMLGWLGFDPSRVAHAWWTLVTYSMVQPGTWSLVLGLFVLLTFGPWVERAWGTRTFLFYLLWCTVGGALTYMVFAQHGVMAGGAAGSFSVLMAFAWLWPYERIHLLGVWSVKVRIAMGLLSGLIIGIGMLELGEPGWGFLAQLGGFVFAGLYLRHPHPATIEELRHRVSTAPDVTDEPPRAIPRSMPRSRRADETDEIVAQSNAVMAEHPRRSAHADVRPEPRGDALNRVLDKISARGLEALSAEDRKLLEELSQRLKGQ